MMTITSRCQLDGYVLFITERHILEKQVSLDPYGHRITDERHLHEYCKECDSFHVPGHRHVESYYDEESREKDRAKLREAIRKAHERKGLERK